MKQLDIQKLQNKLRNQFLKLGVKMSGPETIYFSLFNKIEKNVTIEHYVVFGSKVGNFVEVKKSKIGKNSKVNHLTYIGDAKIGHNVNVGAGTITCNYDGVKKSKTKIKNNVFIGSNSSLVAPLTIEENSVIGAGSVITKKVKKNSLALTRSLQTEVKNYKRKSK